ncbi:MAG: hypothetical protein QNL07_04175 [Candidatus Planktophila sp.]|jgi:uncharacterized membrane protein
MNVAKKVAQYFLGATLIYTGTLHLTSSRLEFQAQVPSGLPFSADFVVIASGIVEIGLGLSLILLWRRYQLAGLLTALFFLAIFPGNISQWMNHTDAFGLDSDRARFTRLFFQPLLIIWALWSTGAWESIRTRGSRK